jgi:nicotinic acid mononucleotide adenylyltransferase
MQVGATMEDALSHLYDRMPSKDVDLIITSILISREVGGDLTEIFDSIARTIRDRHRIEGRPGFIIGDDLLAGFHTWKDAESLAREVDLIVARRTAAAPAPFPYPHRTLANLLLPISSSEIRRRAAAGLTIRFLLPDEVADYIEANALYG